MERLQKLIAESGHCSRRKAEELILAGKVKLNGMVVTELGTKASYEDSIIVENKKIFFNKKEYYLLNKPRSVISSTCDEKGRKVVTEFIDTKANIYPIGRLDYDTTGIILLTNDGELANLLMHPRNKVPKTYLAKLDKIFTLEDYFALKSGIKVKNYFVKPIHLKIKEKDEIKNLSYVEITVNEGKNHMIKNIFATLGYDVLKLSRTRYANLSLGKLKSGEYRILTNEEVEYLYHQKSL